MIAAKRSERLKRRRSSERKNSQVKVWAERKPRGSGYIIYAGIPGTEQKTVAGAAGCRNTLDFNLRKAQNRFLSI